MMRQIVLSEEHGLYRIRDTYGSELGKGTTAEAAFRQAIAKEAGLEPADVEVRSVFEAASWLEALLGQRRDDPEAPVAV